MRGPDREGHRDEASGSAFGTDPESATTGEASTPHSPGTRTEQRRSVGKRLDLRGFDMILDIGCRASPRRVTQAAPRQVTDTKGGAATPPRKAAPSGATLTAAGGGGNLQDSATKRRKSESRRLDLRVVSSEHEFIREKKKKRFLSARRRARCSLGASAEGGGHNGC